ncbi:hypothetical protein AU184_24660 [Mycolicibacterium novocastrense]|uniref:hypothetical protein n=1 Tax=Mycolicibacterium novocastrense TaxID=59813 RepID=UPI0007495C1C|nr:hypothetical protein [Mycolicibacterium novocastrense]KUH66069.1 hypothetical protein AU072_16120 [Mycolicibacterium novocastrense]KUH66551.1 hypothetical protein AU183_17275 [Mycolicibacterium novocastrense]KUH74002.1 hypothetical protein AU184_24660 [Mycolicibacterium novocastrense]
MRAVWLPLLVLVALAAGCHGGQQARADTVEAGLDRPFVLAGGQQAEITGEPLRLRFTEIPEDSRCPTEVECFWTGQARVVVVVDDERSGEQTVEFNTNPAPGQNRQTVQTGDYALTLQALDPYPRTPEDVPPLSEYRATLLVHRTG